MRKRSARRATRRLTIAAVILFALAGAAVACIVPMVASEAPWSDMWFAAHDGSATTGILLGLMLALTGTTAVRALGFDRRGADHARSASRRTSQQQRAA